MNSNLIVLGAAGGLSLLVTAVMVFRQLRTVPVAVRLGAEATAIVALASAVLSWDALSWGAGELGVDRHLTWLYPVAIDGMIAVGTVTALALRHAGRRVRAYVWTLLIGGIAASVVGNAAHATAGSVIHVVGAAMPALALAATLHLLVILVRHVQPTSDAEKRAAGAPKSNVESAMITARSPERALPAPSPERGTEVASRDFAPSAPSARAPRRHGGRRHGAPRAPAGERQRQMRELLSTSEGRELTSEQIGVRLGIDAGYARRLRGEVEGADPELGRRPRVVQVEASAPAAAAEEVRG